MNKVTKFISTMLTVIIVILSGFLVIRNVFFFEIVVVGTSMISTLEEGEMGLATKADFIFNIDREDIIIFEKEDKEIIKRVIGKPLDHIKITNEGIYVNEELIDEDYVSSENLHYTYFENSEFNEVTLNENQYFVLGDNRGNSYDSRYFGPIEKESITGKLKIITHSSTIDGDNIKDKELIPFRFF